MSDFRGRFVWYELMTSDTRAAESFYRSALGWDAKDSGYTDRSYTLFSAGAAMVAGAMPIPEAARAMGMPPAWLGYVAVDDVDAAAAAVTAVGGAVFRAPEDIPGVGRFAVVADPQGAGFMLFHPLGGPQGPEPPAGTPGHVGWHELQASDPERALAFYAGQFGWTAVDAVDMGPIGIYRTFATGGPAVGGIMKKMPEVQRPFWLFYFNVEAIDAAVARVTAAGGAILNGPMEVPGGSWIVQCRDPQGAYFAMVSARR